MLRDLELLPENYYTDEKEIDGHKHPRIGAYSSPGLFHLPAPMYIIEDKDGPWCTPLHQ